MATTKEIMVNGVVTEVTEFDHSAQEIDDATARALAGGAIDQLLAGKAPGGYGLGSSGASISDCNLATSNGFYKWGSACDNAPFAYGCMIVASRYNTGTINLAQLAFQQATTAGIARRSVIDGVFGEWEWINPPMVVGVEYRTTERYQGKPVYAKCVNFGSLPNNTTKDITWSESGIVSDVIHASVITSNGSLVGGVSLSGAEFTATRTNIYIKTTGNYSSTTAHFLLKYTKMTD